VIDFVAQFSFAIDAHSAQAVVAATAVQSFGDGREPAVIQLLPRAFPVNHSVNSRFLVRKWRVTLAL
jgi:hypothetical protein